MVKAIYNIEPEYKVYSDSGICIVDLNFQGKTYRGIAELSPKDEEFFSEKVGLNIALSRARIKTLKAMVERAKLISDTRYQMYQESIEQGHLSPQLVDPTGTFQKKVVSAKKNYNKLLAAIKRERKYLNKYLEDQDKMVERVKLYRSKDKKE